MAYFFDIPIDIISFYSCSKLTQFIAPIMDETTLMCLMRFSFASALARLRYKKPYFQVLSFLLRYYCFGFIDRIQRLVIKHQI